jgi:transcriptional regulator with XRE-family HTH domain
MVQESDICIRTGGRIRLLRMGPSKQWSQQKLADFSGLSRLCINEAESGKAEIGIRTLEKIAMALGVTARELLG